MRKSFRQILLVALVLAFISGAVFVNAANVNIMVNQTALTPLENTEETGRVLWEQGVIEARGMGIAPPNAVSPAQAKALARRAAVLDAQRNMLEQTQGVQVSAETKMVDFMASDVVRSSVSGMIKGAIVVRDLDKVAEDGTYVVVMRMNLYGNNGLSSVVFPEIKPAQIQPFPQPAPSSRPVFKESYTGLVIVAANMGLRPAFSPRVYDQSGNIIYGNKYIDPDFAINQGMVEYSSLSAVSSGNSRAGSKPLVINAIRVTDHNFNLVISDEDAQKVLAAQAQSGFLKKCAVVFVR